MTVASALVTRVRRRCDMVGSGFVTDAEILDYINQGLSELQEEILQAHGEWAYVDTLSGTCATSGSIDLTASMRKVLRIDWQYTDGRRYPLRRVEPTNEVLETTGQAWYPGTVGYWIAWNGLGANPSAVVTPPPLVSTPVRVTYVSNWALTLTPTDTDNRYGYDDLLVCRAAILVKQKEESPVGDLQEELERHLRRIAMRPSDDRGPPRQAPRMYQAARRVVGREP